MDNLNRILLMLFIVASPTRAEAPAEQANSSSCLTGEACETPADACEIPPDSSMNFLIILFVKSNACSRRNKMTETTFLNARIANEKNNKIIPLTLYFKERNSSAIKYGIMSLPSIIILSSNGEIKARYTGYINIDKMNEVLTLLSK